MEIIDSHSHIYPELSVLIKENVASIPAPLYPLLLKIEKLEQKIEMPRSVIYQSIIPMLNKTHETLARFNTPKTTAINSLIDLIYSFTSLGSLLNCTYKELKIQQLSNQIKKSIVIAHPPYISNDFLLELARNDSKIIPIINIPEPINNMEKLIENYILRGAKGLKIHAAASGIRPKSGHHKSILNIAQKNNLPVIIHTGALNIKPIYKTPSYGHAQSFESLIAQFDIPIVLAHMNIHHPEVAIKLCKKYDHVYTDSSWQDEKNILKFINRCGSQKIMFGSDWPIIGNNIEVSLNRILSLREQKKIDQNDIENILSHNAKRIFNIT